MDCLPGPCARRIRPETGQPSALSSPPRSGKNPPVRGAPALHAASLKGSETAYKNDRAAKGVDSQGSPARRGKRPCMPSSSRASRWSCFPTTFEPGKRFETHAATAAAQIVAIAQQRLDLFLPVLDALFETRERLCGCRIRNHGTHRSGNQGRAGPSGTRQPCFCSIIMSGCVTCRGYIRALGIRATRAVENPDRDRRRKGSGSALPGPPGPHARFPFARYIG